jgi:endonuclease-8
MPEGPEIHRAARKLGRLLEGQVIEELFVAFEHLKSPCKDLEGRRIIAVEAHGKAILNRFDNGLNIYSHNQLYGLWRLVRRGQTPDTNRQLRLALHTEEHSALLYSASDIELLRDAELATHSYLTRLGPDVLQQQVSLETVQSQVEEQRFQGRSLTSLLLDQGFLAGLGNYLRSEILFVAGIGPDFRLKDCNETQKTALSRASLLLPRRSFETGGITNDDERVEQLKEQGRSGRGLRFSVFEREGESCYECGTTIEKIKAGGRRLYYCPRCQPAK